MAECSGSQSNMGSNPIRVKISCNSTVEFCAIEYDPGSNPGGPRNSTSQGVIMSEGYTGPRWQLYKYQELYDYRYYRNIPEWMKSHICLCKEFVAFDLRTGKKYPTCKECGGMMHYLIHRCTSCETIFLKCFLHPDYCPSPSCVKCWDCVQTSGPCTIDFHQRPRPWDSEVSPPMFKSPRKFTKEELDNFDIFA